jgi:hypothetical protein
MAASGAGGLKPIRITGSSAQRRASAAANSGSTGRSACTAARILTLTLTSGFLAPIGTGAGRLASQDFRSYSASGRPGVASGGRPAAARWGHCIAPHRPRGRLVSAR